MSANQETAVVTSLQGSLLRLGDTREIAIYVKDGAGWVADFRHGVEQLQPAAAWYTGNGRKLAYAQRRREVEMVAPIPADVVARIERLHRPQGRPGGHPGSLLARLLARFRAASGAVLAG